MREIIFENVTDFNVDHIFDCGQAFRWNLRPDGSYLGVVGESLALLSFNAGQDDNGTVRIQIAGTEGAGERNEECDSKEREFWRHYLDLDRDYGEIKRYLSKDDSYMAKAISYGEGIRILNQDAWEVFISFIVSQRNKITRIKNCVESLCRNFGRRMVVSDEGSVFNGEYFTFPGLETLAGLTAKDLDVCKLGYRGGYVVRAAQQVLEAGGEDYLEQLRHMELALAEKELFTYYGVGSKVAECILLFGLGHTEGFPVDVWIERGMHELYGIEKSDKRAMLNYAREHFGEFAGMAQQYIFYYMREVKKELAEQAGW